MFSVRGVYDISVKEGRKNIYIYKAGKPHCIRQNVWRNTCPWCDRPDRERANEHEGGNHKGA